MTRVILARRRHGPAAVTKVNNRMPINSCFAGKTMQGKDFPASVRVKYPHGVPFNGFVAQTYS